MIDLPMIILIGIGAMGFMAIGVILFFVVYQRRIIYQQEKFQEKESHYQKELLTSTIKTQEIERQRIAKDLHDSVGGTLSATKLYLHHLNHHQPDEKFHQLKSEATKLLDDTIVNIRQTTKNLLPVNLERFGLAAAVEDLMKQISQLNVLQIQFSYNVEERFEPDKELALFRIIQELINNTLKHAKASEIQLILHFSEATLNFLYRDNGIGFDLNTLQTNQSVGLTSIQSRVEYLKAKMDLKTASGEGVCFSIQCSINTKVLPNTLYHDKNSPSR